MVHIVTSESHICPKCKKENMGATEYLYEMYICPTCYESFENELLPIIKKKIINYFQPDSSKREDSVLNTIPEYGSKSSLNFDEWQRRCGARNSMET